MLIDTKLIALLSYENNVGPYPKHQLFLSFFFLYLLPHCYITMLTNCPDSLFIAKDFICHINKAFFKLLIIYNLPVPTRGRWKLKRERPVKGVRITDSSHLTPDTQDVRSALPSALLQHTYWLLSLEKVRDKKEAMTLHSPRSCRRSAPKLRREGSAEKTNIAGLRAGLIHSLDLLKHEEKVIKQITKSGFPRMFLGIPTLGEKADVSISVKVFHSHQLLFFCCCFLRRGKINGYL